MEKLVLACLLHVALSTQNLQQSCILPSGECSYNVQLAPPGGCGGPDDQKLADLASRVEMLEKGQSGPQQGKTDLLGKENDALKKQLEQSQADKQLLENQVETMTKRLALLTGNLNKVTAEKSAQIRDMEKRLTTCKADSNKLKARNDWLTKAVKAVAPPSCQEWFDAGFQTTGTFFIDPDGNQKGVDPFEVTCSVTPGRRVATTVHNNAETRTPITNKCEPAYCSVQNISYAASMDQMVALIGISNTCQQYIKYECHAAVLNMYNGAWYSRDGKQMDYWGGATPGSKKCSCGMTDTCSNKGAPCNCHANEHVWREDSGYLHDKNTLPVSQLSFGDLVSVNEKGFYSVGPLMCYR